MEIPAALPPKSRMRTSLAVLLLFLTTVYSSPVMAEEFNQPIEFNHKTHAGTNEIPCEFCHSYARRSINSGAPSMESCFGCHRVVKGSDEKQQKEIAKLLEFWENQKTIPWKKIHDVPDFVHFSHKRHIQAGFDCTECHGDINQLEILSMATMASDLSMGWCMTCHIKEQQTLKGKIVGPVRKTRGGNVLKAASIPQPDGTMLGSKDCYICHK